LVKILGFAVRPPAIVITGLRASIIKNTTTALRPGLLFCSNDRRSVRCGRRVKPGLEGTVVV
jgi:hypothetical protein